MHRLITGTRIIYLFAILIASNIILTGALIYILYNQTVSSLNNNLSGTVQRQKTLIWELSSHGMSSSQIIQFIGEMQNKYYKLGISGEFVIAKKYNDSLKLLFSLKKDVILKHPGINDNGYPMELALMGKSGFVKAKDYNGNLVYAAYTYVPELEWGIVAKIPVIEVNRPYINTVKVAVVIAFILIVICVFLFLKITNPIIEKLYNSKQILKKSNEEYSALNEEYASINEELRSSEEELQAQNNELRMIKNDLEKKEALLNESQQVAKLGHYVFDVLSGFWESSPTLDELFGLDKNFVKNVDGWMQIIHPQFKNEMFDYLTHQVLTNHLPFDKVYKITKVDDNEERWVHGLGKLKFNYNGELIEMFGTIQDITEQKSTNDNLNREQLLFSKLFEALPDRIYFKDTKSRFIRINFAAAKFFGFSNPKEAIGKTDFDIFSEQHARQAFDDEQRIIKTGDIIVEKEEMETRNDGSITWVLTTKIPIYENGIVSGIMGISRDITEKKKTENDLIQAKEKAEENDRLKTAFLQNVSHEIRTPMNAIMGFSELLVTRFQDKVSVEKFSRIIMQRSADLLQIITEILDIAKIESNQLPVYKEVCKLEPIFKEIEDFFIEHSKRINKEHIKLSINLECNAASLFIITDKVKLKQIFINLIGNAYKFTDLGIIEVGCQLDSNQKLIFYVSDTGIGIPKDKQSLIFERFAQVDQGNSRLYGGTGLGLTIIQGLLKLLNGKIWLESEPGKGSTFYFSFPYENALYAQPNEIIEKINDDLSFNGETVLIVEDDEYNADYMKEILTGLGLNIMHTIYGKEAVAIAINNKIDIILMDIRLPDIDGYEAVKQIKQVKPDIKIVAQTAYTASIDMQKALDTGCIDFISKPVKSAVLISKLKTHL